MQLLLIRIERPLMKLIGKFVLNVGAERELLFDCFLFFLEARSVGKAWRHLSIGQSISKSRKSVSFKSYFCLFSLFARWSPMLWVCLFP